MNVIFYNSFIRDLKKLQDVNLMKNIKKAITKVENSQSIKELTSIKHLSNSGPYYRIKIGDFRIGIKYENNTISFIRCLHRKDIYKKFP